jgi:MoaA/NifB/PqqE/SkfB family radical SAM enzyme
MNIHNLTPEEKRTQYDEHVGIDFPKNYSISFGEYPCNRRCRMCPMYGNPPSTKSYITQKVLDRACEDFGDRNNVLEVSAYGDTFQHPDAMDMLVSIRKQCPNASIVVATNGTLLDRELSLRIVESGIDHLSFSLDAGSHESYKWLTGSDGYGTVCENVMNLVDIRNQKKAHHLKITTHIIGIQELAHEFDDFVKKWSQIADRASVRPFGNWAGLVDGNNINPRKEQVIPSQRYPCAWPWFATKVQSNGNISKCFVSVTGDADSVGNILNESFESIWHGERIKRIRQRHLTNNEKCLKHCESCMIWSLFPNFWAKNNDGTWSDKPDKERA